MKHFGYTLMIFACFLLQLTLNPPQDTGIWATALILTLLLVAGAFVVGKATEDEV